MSELSSLINAVPIEAIAERFGVSPIEARKAVEAALPSLFGGMEANSRDPHGEESLARALNDHAESNLLEDDVDPDQIDVEDGEKITAHVFGEQKDAVAMQAAAAAGTEKSLLEKVLPFVAPLAMAWLAKRFSERQHQAPAPRTESAPADVQPTSQEAEQTGGGLGDLLGGILGGGDGKNAGLDDLLGQLGGLLGGGRR